MYLGSCQGLLTTSFIQCHRKYSNVFLKAIHRTYTVHISEYFRSLHFEKLLRTSHRWKVTYSRLQRNCTYAVHTYIHMHLWYTVASHCFTKCLNGKAAITQQQQQDSRCHEEPTSGHVTTVTEQTWQFKKNNMKNSTNDYIQNNHISMTNKITSTLFLINNLFTVIIFVIFKVIISLCHHLMLSLLHLLSFLHRHFFHHHYC